MFVGQSSLSVVEQGSVICEKSDPGFDLLRQVIYVYKKEN